MQIVTESYGNPGLGTKTHNYGRVSVDISYNKIAAKGPFQTHFRVRVLLIIEELTVTMKCIVEQ